MAVTLNNVASAAGVSKTTASLILNNRQSGRFTSETRQRVLSAARQLKYRVPAHRPVRRGTGTASVAFLLKEKLGAGTDRASYYARLVDGLQDAARDAGLTVNVGTGLDEPDAQIEFLRQHQPLLGVVTGAPLCNTAMEEIALHQVPMIIAGDVHLERPGACCQVYGDNYEGGRLATQHLIEMGHQRIACVGYPQLRGFFSQRMAGHLSALIEAGLPIDNDLIVTPTGPATLGETLSRVMAGDAASRPTAFFSASAEVVFHLIDWLRSRSIDVPGQVSVMGYDDWPMFEYLSPAITTVTVCPEQVGRLAVREVLAQAEVGVAAPHTRLIPPKLIERRSVTPPIRPTPTL